MAAALTAHRSKLIGAVVVIALGALLIATGEENALIIGLTTGSAYGMVALGLVLIYKSSGVFNFAQGEFGTVALFAPVPARLPRPVLGGARSARWSSPARWVSSRSGSSSGRCSTPLG